MEFNFPIINIPNTIEDKKYQKENQRHNQFNLFDLESNFEDDDSVSGSSYDDQSY